MSPTILAASAGYLDFASLHLDPVIVNLGLFQLRWYSVAYIVGIVIGWWYLLKLIAQPGAPMARRHADDILFYATLGILIGGRLAYCLFYRPDIFLHPQDVLKLWEGGMSFHGGVIGVTIALLWLSRAEHLQWLRVHDYVACCVPFGLFFGRLANFVNGELWGRPTTVPWAMIFPGAPDALPRHPSQLYEAGLEGIGLFLLLWFLFWRTDARYEPGKLVGTFLLGYGLIRFGLEFVRAPDVGVAVIAGFTRGQLLTLPMLVGGAWLVSTAKGRRVRVEPIAGGASVS